MHGIIIYYERCYVFFIKCLNSVFLHNVIIKCMDTRQKKEREITIAYTYAYRWKHWICTHHTVASSLFVIKWFKRWYFYFIVEKIKILEEKKIAQRRKVFLLFYHYYFMCSRLVMEIQQKTFILERKVYDVLVHCIWCVNNEFVSPFTREIFTNFENFTFFFAKVLYFGKISKSLIREILCSKIFIFFFWKLL